MLLFGVFSTSVNAEDAQSYDFEFYGYDSLDPYQMWQGTFTSGTEFSVESPVLEDRVIDDYYEVYFDVYFYHTDKSPLVKKNHKFYFTLSNMQFDYSYAQYITNNRKFTMKKFDSISVTLEYADGTSETFTDGINFSYDSEEATHSIDIDQRTTTKDINRIYIQYTYNLHERTGLSGTRDVKFYSASNGAVDIVIQSEEAGLLSGILGIITQGFKDIGTWFTNLFNSIVELPQKLWNLISEGLKNLFVPDSEYMANYSGNWDNLLKTRFGAIYEVGDIISDFAESIKYSSTTGSIDIPLVTLPLGSSSFSFGGNTVSIIPDGNFVILIDTAKSILSIICTFFFVNGLRKRYDEIMGGKQ